MCGQCQLIRKECFKGCKQKETNVASYILHLSFCCFISRCYIRALPFRAYYLHRAIIFCYAKKSFEHYYSKSEAHFFGRKEYYKWDCAWVRKMSKVIKWKGWGWHRRRWIGGIYRETDRLTDWLTWPHLTNKNNYIYTSVDRIGRRLTSILQVSYFEAISLTRLNTVCVWPEGDTD